MYYFNSGLSNKVFNSFSLFYKCNDGIIFTSSSLTGLTFLCRGSISEIRHGIRKQKGLLRRIARSTKELERQRTESVERKTGPGHDQDDEDNESGSHNDTNSDETDSGEPPAKRRSLSPQAGAKLSPSPARTRSGKMYHPSIASNNQDIILDKAFLMSEGHQDGSVEVFENKSQSPHIPCNPQTASRGHLLRRASSPRVKERYSLRRSLSPVSSTRSSSFTSVAPQQQTFGLQCRPDTPYSEQQKMSTSHNTSKGRPHTGSSNTTISNPLHSKSKNPKPMAAPVDACLDSPVPPNTLQQPSKQPVSSKMQNYRSPDVESDSVSDEIGADGSSGVMKSIECDEPSGFNHYQTRPRNISKSLVIRRTRTEVTVDKAADANTSEELLDVSFREEDLLIDGIMSTNGDPVAVSQSSVSPGESSTNHEIHHSAYRVPASKSDCSTRYSYYHSQGSAYNRDVQSSLYNTSLRRPKQTPQQSANTKPQPPTPPANEATEAHALQRRIPPGYSLKNWDPAEEPLMLLGSVFDANSLGNGSMTGLYTIMVQQRPYLKWLASSGCCSSNSPVKSSVSKNACLAYVSKGTVRRLTISSSPARG